MLSLHPEGLGDTTLECGSVTASWENLTKKMQETGGSKRSFQIRSFSVGPFQGVAVLYGMSRKTLYLSAIRYVFLLSGGQFIKV